jgi:hypothetical protein
MRVARFQGTSILNDFQGPDVCEFGAERSHKPAHRWPLNGIANHHDVGGTTAALEDDHSDVILVMIPQAET